MTRVNSFSWEFCLGWDGVFHLVGIRESLKSPLRESADCRLKRVDHIKSSSEAAAVQPHMISAKIEHVVL
jgi:hypothetical protein